MSKLGIPLFSVDNRLIIVTSSLIAQYNQRPVLLTDEATLLADHMIDASTAQETAGKDTILNMSRNSIWGWQSASHVLPPSV